jgi:hypothetical protein
MGERAGFIRDLSPTTCDHLLSFVLTCQRRQQTIDHRFRLWRQNGKSCVILTPSVSAHFQTPLAPSRGLPIQG